MPITHSLSLKVHAKTCIKTPIGFLSLASCIFEEREYLCTLAFSDEAKRSEADPFLQSVEAQLKEYFGGTRKVFDVPLLACGTDFQLSVWSSLAQIPYGATRSYGDIAQSIGRPKAARAVGMACHVNPICIIIPCHRIIGANGSLTGFGGGLPLKSRLLAFEGVNC